MRGYYVQGRFSQNVCLEKREEEDWKENERWGIHYRGSSPSQSSLLFVARSQEASIELWGQFKGGKRINSNESNSEVIN